MIGDKNFIRKKLDDKSILIDKRFKKNLKNNLFKGESSFMANKNIQLNIKQLAKQKHFIYSGFAALLIVAGTAAYALDNRSENLARQSIIEDTVELPQNLDGVLAIEEMTVLAQNDAPVGATISKVEIENEHGVVLYKVKFSDGSYRLYDAKTGLPYVDTSAGVETDESVPAGFVAGITLQQARDTAAAQRPGKTITKIELETENGVVVYSVRFSDDGRVDVNATDGSVVRVRNAETDNSSDDSEDSNKDSDDSVDSEDHQEEDMEDDGDRSGSGSDDDKDSDEDNSNSGSGSDDNNN